MRGSTAFVYPDDSAMKMRIAAAVVAAAEEEHSLT